MSVNDTHDGYIVLGKPELTDEEIQKLKQKWAESYEGAVDFANVAVIGEDGDERDDGDT